MILTLEKDVVYDWLEKQGFDVSVIQKGKEPEGGESNPTEPDTIEVSIAIIERPSPRITSHGRGGEVTTSKPQPDTNPQIDEEIAKKIGYLGEKHVHENKIIEDYYEQIVSVNWLNKEEESEKPYDFEVTFNDGLKHYWEIKSTPSGTKAEFPISSNEMKFALENSEAYFIIRVFNAGLQKPECTILHNPIDLIKRGKIKINDVKMEIIDSKLVELHQ